MSLNNKRICITGGCGSVGSEIVSPTRICLKMWKSAIYKALVKIRQIYWTLLGSRSIAVFGQELNVTPNTIFPSYWNLKLPTGAYDSQIVKYADFVQFHAIVKCLSQQTQSPIIIEVGAHHGAYAVALGKLIKHHHGRLLALEPNPNSFSILKRNVRLNDLQNVVICEPIAVSDAPGEMQLSLDGSQSHITQMNEGVKVNVTTLAQLIEKHELPAVDLLLIDVEGAELPVLKGFPWHLFKPGKIFCELHPYAWENFGYSGYDLRLFLKNHGYRCFDMYLHEYKQFNLISYIGPTLFVSE